MLTKTIYKSFILLFLFAVFNIGNISQTSAVNTANNFDSFRDVPGVTQEQIREIELLLEGRYYFVHGMFQNDEAFYTVDGRLSGFAVRMSVWLGDLFGVPFIPVMYDWCELVQGRVNDEIDFTSHLFLTAERSQRYATTSPIAKRALSIARLANAEPLEEIIRERPPRFVFYSCTTTDRMLSSANVFTEFEAIHSTCRDEISEIIINGDADGIIGDGTLRFSLNFPDFTVSNLYPLVFAPVAFTAFDPELAPIVDVVQKILEAGGMSIFADMYAQGRIDHKRHRMSLLLSDEKRTFIADNLVIPIAAHGYSYPISFFNEWEDAFQGITHDILDKIEAITGLTFEIVHEEPLSVSEVLQMVEETEVYLGAGLIRMGRSFEERFLLTNSFFSDNYAFLSRAILPNITVNEVLYKNVGVVENSVYEEMFHSWFPGHMNISNFSDMDSLLRALEYGEIDMVLSSERGLSRGVNYLEFSGIRANIVLGETYYVAFAICKTMPILHSIINDALYIIDSQVISEQWMSMSFDYNARILRERQLALMITVASLSIILLLAFALLYTLYNDRWRLEKLVAERTQALTEESSTLAAVFESMPDLLYCKSLEMHYTRVNKSFEDFFNVERSKVIGLNAGEAFLLSGELLDDWHRSDHEVIEQQKSSRKEYNLSDVNGNTRTLETILSPILQDDKVMGLLGLSRDITERKELEEEMKRVSQIKTAFLANMSHEIRTPMNSIVGFSELALEVEMSPTARSYLKTIIENSQWLLQIINDILDVTRIESGKVDLEYLPYDIGELLAQCQSIVFPKAIGKNIELLFHAEPIEEGKLLLGDPGRLRQILLNLISNAVKFTDEGVVKVKSFVVNETESNATIRCEVIDSGIGMTKEQINRIIEPFTQADSSITRRFGGTGLGLAIVTSYLEMMGGCLAIDSVAGVGSKFSFELTFDKTEAEKADITGQRTSSAIEKPRFNGEVLVFEDNEVNQAVITEHLSRLGLKVQIVQNGQIGVDLLKERMQNDTAFDLILMDIQMPVMDGLDAVKMINKMGGNTPIVMMTANVMPSDKRIYEGLGVKDCIGKPFMAQELWRCLLKYLNPVKETDSEKSENAKNTDRKIEGMTDEELEQWLIQLFIKGNLNTYEEISSAIKDGDIKLAHRLAHTLKSSAEHVKKSDLQKVAAELESLLSQGDSCDEAIVTAALQKLKIELQLALESFQ